MGVTGLLLLGQFYTIQMQIYVLFCTRLQEPKTKRFFEIVQGILEIIQFIVNVLSDKRDIFCKKIIKGTFLALQMESFGPKNSNYMQGLKSAGMALPCQKGPQESCQAVFQKFFLFWVAMNCQQCWKTKLGRSLSFKVQSSKITVCKYINLNRAAPKQYYAQDNFKAKSFATFCLQNR